MKSPKPKGKATRRKKASGERRNKYGNDRTVVDGKSFDSKREADRYSELKLLQSGGMIRDLELQVAVMLQGMNGPLKTATGRAMKCTVDFRYWCEDRQAWIYEDAKGYPSRDWPVRKAVLAAQGIGAPGTDQL